jgi:hypothetical protein
LLTASFFFPDKTDACVRVLSRCRHCWDYSAQLAAHNLYFFFFLFISSHVHCNSQPQTPLSLLRTVDHGKTTMVDELLKAADRSRLGGSNNQGPTLNRLMDSGELEIERGITITSKVTRLEYRPALSHEDEPPYILNIVDTPGHADFCGEVSLPLCLAW